MSKRPGRISNHLHALLVAMIVITASSAHGQIVSEWETDVSKFLARVKSVDFLIDRFNNQPDGTGRNIKMPEATKAAAFRAERSANIFSLFDHEVLNRKDQALKKRLISFFATVNDSINPVFLHFDDPSWFASVDFDGTLDGKATEFTLYLQTSKSTAGVYTWVAKFVESKSLHLTEKMDSALVFAPSAHGTDFMDVRLKLKEMTPARPRPKVAATSTLVQQLSSGHLVVGQIRKIEYQFLQVPGWKWKVIYINRTTANSGWLIRDLVPCTAEERATLLASKGLL